MTRKQAEKMVLEILEIADYDLWKTYVPESSELDPEEIKDMMDELVNVVLRYVGKQ